MAVIWITHDLGVIAGLADRVLVMYAGFVVEEAPVKQLYAAPKHPYTQGLLQSLPRIDEHGAQLTSIEGLPPDGLTMAVSCPFAPRCAYAFERCYKENPMLVPVANSHSVACWLGR